MFGIPALLMGPIITIVVSFLKRIWPGVGDHAKLAAAVLAAGASVVSVAVGHPNPAVDLLTGLSQQIGTLAATAATATAAAIAAHEVATPVSNAIAGRVAATPSAPSAPTSPLQGK